MMWGDGVTRRRQQVLTVEDIESLSALADYSDLVADVAAPADPVGDTLDELSRSDSWRPTWSAEQKDAFILRARESAGEWEARGFGVLALERDEPLVEVVVAAATVHGEP
jgi:hypothetical protein